MNVDVHSVQTYGGQRLILSDQELALQKALKEGFHSPEHGEPVALLCRIHLEGNLRRYLENHTDRKTASSACNAVFGANGIIYSTSRTEFEDAVLKFNSKYGEHFDPKRKETLFNNIWYNIIEPHLQFPEIQTDSTTNRNESINASTMSLIEHKPKPFDEMVKVSAGRVSAQVRFLLFFSFLIVRSFPYFC